MGLVNRLRYLGIYITPSAERELSSGFTYQAGGYDPNTNYYLPPTQEEGWELVNIGNEIERTPMFRRRIGEINIPAKKRNRNNIKDNIV